MSIPTAVLFDVDGTLVDSNDAHANAWVAALAEHGISVGFAAVRRCIGMGGDKLLPALTGVELESELGAAISARRSRIFANQFLPTLKPFPDAGRLVAVLKEQGFTVVAASSAKRDELKPLLQVAEAEHLMDETTSSDDARHSKPDPDIIAFRCGGWADADLKGAIAIYDGPSDLLARLDESPLRLSTT